MQNEKCRDEIIHFWSLGPLKTLIYHPFFENVQTWTVLSFSLYRGLKSGML